MNRLAGVEDGEVSGRGRRGGELSSQDAAARPLAYSLSTHRSSTVQDSSPGACFPSELGTRVLLTRR